MCLYRHLSPLVVINPVSYIREKSLLFSLCKNKAYIIITGSHRELPF
jgi:hypothetical protein